MVESYVSRSLVVAVVLWVTTATFMVAAWMVVLLDSNDWMVGGMLAATGLVFSAMAATAHCQVVGMRISALVRTTAELRAPTQRGSDREVRPIR